MTLLRRVRVGDPAHGGHCVARVDGQVVFVRHSAPGEIVDVRITQRRSRFWRGEAVTVHQPSPDRVPSVWPEAGPGGVGGGELAHLRLSAQRGWKTQVLHDTMRRIGGIELAEHGFGEVAVASIEDPGDDTGVATRTRIQLVTTPAGDAGMYRHRSHDVIAVSQLPLAAPGIDTEELLRPGRWREVPAGTKITALAPSDSPPVVLADNRMLLGASRYVREAVAWNNATLGYRVAATGFWQVHRNAPRALLEAVMTAAEPESGDRVLELYSGAGLFTKPLAQAVGEHGEVISVEGSDQAVRDARRNLHRYPRARLRHAAVTPEVITDAPATDIVVLDPPRSGAGPDVMAAIAQRKPRAIVYVACDPAALARDLRAARVAGYELGTLKALDLFPHTHHLEAIATLRPTRGPRGLTAAHKVS